MADLGGDLDGEEEELDGYLDGKEADLHGDMDGEEEELDG